MMILTILEKVSIQTLHLLLLLQSCEVGKVQTQRERTWSSTQGAAQNRPRPAQASPVALGSVGQYLRVALCWEHCL
jgi:hypothetical protein